MKGMDLSIYCMQVMRVKDKEIYDGYILEDGDIYIYIYIYTSLKMEIYTYILDDGERDIFEDRYILEDGYIYP